MTDAVETTDEVENEEVETEEAVEVEEVEAEDPVAGLKKALAAERKAHRDESRRAKALEQQLADKDKPAEEAALDQARREAREEAMTASHARLVRAELKAALAGRVSNPAVALRLIDASEIEVTADGDVDSDSVAAAVDALLAEAPELASKRFSGTADQGTKGKSDKPSQMTHEEVKRLSAEGRHDEIVKAEREGRLNDLMNR
jgi:hypothetical protein